MNDLNLQSIIAFAAIVIGMTLGRMLADELIRRARARRVSEAIGEYPEARLDRADHEAEPPASDDAAYEAFIADMAAVRPKPVRALNYSPQPNEVEFLEAPIPTDDHLNTTSMNLGGIPAATVKSYGGGLERLNISYLAAATSTCAWAQVDAAPDTGRETVDAEPIDDLGSYRVPKRSVAALRGVERDCE